MSDLKPIETTYKGYRFRSRLEARWAVFFDALGMEWKYEAEGYDLGEGKLYLPDFLLGGKVFAEVKGQEFTVKEINLCRLLARKSGHAVMLLSGPPEYRPYPLEKPDGLLDERAFEQPEVEEAIARARSARFEHGEVPDQERIEARAPRRGRRERYTERGGSAERELIRAMLLDPAKVEGIAEKLGPESFRNPTYRAIYRSLLENTPLQGEAAVMATEIETEGAEVIDSDRTISDSLSALRARELDQRLAEIDRLIPLASVAEKDELLSEKQGIMRELKSAGRQHFQAFRQRRGS